MPPKYGSFVSVPAGDMQRHIAFCARALADGGAAYICVADRPEVMPLWMLRYRSRPNMLELQLSSGHLGRPVVAKLDVEFARDAVACVRRLSPKTRRLSRLIIRYRADDALTPLALVYTLDTVSRILGLHPPFSYCIWHRGPFDPAYVFTSDDPVGSTLSYRAGYAVGSALGKVAQVLSPSRPKT